MATNLFAKAKSNAKTTSAKKKDEKHSEILLEKDFPNISEKLNRYNKLKRDFANMETELEELNHEFKTIGKDVYIDLYKDNGLNPESFYLEGEKGGRVMFIPQDKYLTINEARASQLTSEFGEDIVSSTTKFVFNTALLEKYTDVLSDLIVGCDQISDTDKENLIVAETKWTIKTGTIDKLMSFGSKMKNVFAEICPVFQIKQA